MFAPAVLIAASVTLSQTPDTLNAVIITAEKDITARSSAPAQRVSASRLEKTGAITIEEALKTFSGVSVKDYGGCGGLKSVNIRNFGSQHTGVVYDGITITDAQNGQVDISRFNLNNLSSISLEISGSDDIMRSARLAGNVGVLSIESAMPVFEQRKSRVTGQIRRSSFNTGNYYLGAQRRLGTYWSADISANYTKADGQYPFSLKNGGTTTTEYRINEVENFSVESNLYGSTAHGEFKAKVSYYAGDRALPGSVILYKNECHEWLQDRDMLASVRYDTHIGGSLRMKFGMSALNKWNMYTNNDTAYPQTVQDIYSQTEYSGTECIMWTPLKHLSFSNATDLVINHLESNLQLCPSPTRTSVFSVLNAKYSPDRFTLVASLLLTFASERVKSGDKPPQRSHLSPSISCSYRLPCKENIHLRASFKDSYRMPTFNDMYYPRLGNTGLRAEKAYQTNMGVTWRKTIGRHNASITADGYYNMVRDKIVAVPSLFIWSMRNVDKVEMAGCDISASYDVAISENIRLLSAMNYSYQYAVDITDPGQKNYRHQIPYAPRHCGNASITLETGWFNVGYILSAAGERYSLAQNTPAYRIEPYADHSVSINRTFTFGKRHTWGLHLSAEALNLANVNYEIIKYYPMPGRHYRLTAKISF